MYTAPPTSRQTALRVPEPTAIPRHSHQRPKTQPYIHNQCVSSRSVQDPRVLHSENWGHSYTYQWRIPAPGIPWTLVSLTSKPTVALGPTLPTQRGGQQPQDTLSPQAYRPTPPTCRPVPALGPRPLGLQPHPSAYLSLKASLTTPVGEHSLGQ